MKIDESGESSETRLILEGELDLATADVLRSRLRELREQRIDVRLDLSRLHFIDGSGGHVLVDATSESHFSGWRFRIDSTVSPQVARFFKLARIERLLGPPRTAHRRTTKAAR